MRALARKSLWPILLLFISLSLSGIGLTQNLSDAEKICSDMSSSNLALAKSAGYDLDSLCSSFNPIATQKETSPKELSSPSYRATPSSPDSQPRADVASISKGKPVTKGKTLKPFGYDLFANVPSTFAASNNIPVPLNYSLGPGDELVILFYGKLNQSFTLKINRDGLVNFPELGPVLLAGLSFKEAKDMLQSRIAAQVIGTQANISMGTLRSMQIFVLGEAFKPGAYIVSSLSTITHALMSAGGVSDIASLRNIQLKREGKTIATFDLYDLLLSGRVANNVRLQPSDVIFIPTVGDLASIEGQVLRPAIYELKGETTVEDLLALSGGLGPKAFTHSARIERINDDRLTVVDIDLTTLSGKGHRIQSGDHIRVDSIINRKESIVTLKGHVYHPGNSSWQQGMKLSDLINNLNQFPPQLDLNYGLIVREFGPISDLKVLPFSPGDILSGSESKQDVELKPRDKVYVFSVGPGRAAQIKPLLDRLDFQARSGEYAKTVSISGLVRLAGEVPLTEGMKISDLIKASGGLGVSHGPDTYAVLFRKILPRGNIQALSVDLNMLTSSKQSEANLTLHPQDKLFLFSADEIRASRLTSMLEKLRAQTRSGVPTKIVQISGKVRFPGHYPLTPDMSIDNLVAAAGGLTDAAYLGSAEISRTDLSVPDEASNKIFEITLPSSLSLEPHDGLLIKSIPEFREREKIKLSGEVLFPGVYSFSRGETLLSVIERAGGFTDSAFIDGAVFTRIKLKEREDIELNNLKAKLDETLKSEQLTSINSFDEVDFERQQAKKKALADLNSVRAIGRLLIPLQKITDGIGPDVFLENGDNLLIPQISQEVSVIGEVHRQISFLHNLDFKIKDYLEQAGGILKSADKRGIYLVKASGRIVIPKRRLILFPSKNIRVEPGDTIVVPLDTDQKNLRGIPLLAEVSGIIYQLSLGAAAINSLNNR